MKKLFIALCSWSLVFGFATCVKAEEPDDIVCYYDFDEEGNQVYVCEEEPGIEPATICGLECWDA